jgi:uncharacterized iron-regulated membrane protein
MSEAWSRQGADGGGDAAAQIDFSLWLGDHVGRILYASAISLGMLLLLAGLIAWRAVNLPFLICSLVVVAIGVVLVIYELGDLTLGVVRVARRLPEDTQDGC